jgi:hypothetical protein
MLAPAEFPLQIVKLVPKPFDGDDWLFEIKARRIPNPRDSRWRFDPPLHPQWA